MVGLILSFSFFSFGQGTCKQDIAISNSNNGLKAIGGAVVTVCPGGSSIYPCTLSTIYSNSTLTTPLQNPFTADVNGNYSWCAAPGKYEVCVGGIGYATICQSSVNISSDPLSLNGYRFALSDGWVCDNITDDTSAFNASLVAISNAGGGELVLPPNKTCFIGGQVTLPNDGASPPKQKSIKISGGVAGGLAQGYNLSCNGGTILNMTFASATGKIDTRGLGKLEVSGVCFKDTATDGKPFIFTTLTTIHFHHNQFFGNSSASPKQDVFILGGLGTAVDGTANSEFQGYGTVIDSNQADQIGRFALLQNQANAIQIVNNHIYAFGGNSTQGVIEINPGGAIGATFAGGNYIAGNLLEVFGYKYGVNVVINGYGNIISGNQCWDSTATTTACVNIAPSAGNSANQVIDSNPDLIGSHPSPSTVSVLDSIWTNGLFLGQTGSATNPTFSWTGFGSNPPGFYRIGQAVSLASGGVPTHNWDFDFAGQMRTRSDGSYCFSSTTDPGGVGDAGYSRGGSGIHLFGNCTSGDFSGTIKTTFVNAVTGFLVNGLATSGRFLKCDGTKCAFSTGSASGIGTPTVCTNQAVTGFTLNSDAAPTSTCSTITSSYVDTSIAKTGTDINTSNQVTQVSTTLGNYNGSATAGLGAAIPRGYARQVGQTASVALTTINTSIGADAMYLLVSEFDCDTSVAGATVTPTFSWTDTSNTVISVSGGTATCTTLGVGSNAFNTFGFIAKASTAIKYSVAITGSPNYDGRISIIQLGTN